MTAVERIRRRDLDPFAWFDNAFAPFTGPLSWPFGTQHTVRVEESESEGRYTVRAELPGVDPDEDITVEISEGVLEIKAERRQEERTADRSEFRYGSFVRRLTLPPGASEDDVRASYRNGILEVEVSVAQRQAGARHTIHIAHGDAPATDGEAVGPAQS